MTSAAVTTASWGRARWKRGVGLAGLPGPLQGPSGSVYDPGPGEQTGLTVELFVNGAWTDISPFVYYKNRVKITRGKPNETSAIQPQTCTFTVNNRDGRFSPRNPLGPYYGQIGRNTPVRVSRLQNGVRRYRFVGEVPAWPTTWDISGTDVYASVTAAGQMRRLFQGNLPLHSTLYRAYAFGFAWGLTPVAYWPCEDGTSATSIAAGLPGMSPMTLSGQALPTFASNSSFVCSLPLPLLSASIWTGQIPAHTAGTDNTLRFLLSIPPTGGYDTGVLARFYTTGTVARVDLQYGATGNGSLNLTGYNGAGTQLFTTGYQSPSAFAGLVGFNGMPAMISMELRTNGAAIVYGVSFMPLVSSATALFTTYGLGGGTLAASSVGTATSVAINPDGHFNDTAVGHVNYRQFYDSLSNVSTQLNAWVTEPPLPGQWVGSAFPGRFMRLCQEQNVPAAVILGTGANVGDPTSMGFQLNDTFTNLVQEPATSTGGLLFESREQASLVLRERLSLYNQAAKLTLDHSQHQLSGPLNPVDDDALTRNDVTVTRINGSSNQQALTSGALSNQSPPNGVGEYATTYSISLGSDTQLPDQAGWRLHMGTVDQPRYPAIPINLRHTTFTSNLDLMNAALTIDVGDRLVVSNPPAWMPPDQISQIVQGYTETMGVFEHDIVFTCSPEDPYKIGLLDDPVLGRLDTDGSTLAVGVSSGATTLSVLTTSLTGALWTTAGGDFPFDVNIGGERCTVTAIANGPAPLIGGADGTFESGISGWTATWGASGTWTSSSAQAHTGTLSGLYTATATGSAAIYTGYVPVTPGAVYTATGWVLNQVGFPNIAALIQWYTAGQVLISGINGVGAFAPSSWTAVTITGTAPPTAAFAVISFSGNVSGASGFYVDDMTLTPSPTPQVFTVTRSVNGVAKAQAANTDVRLWQPMILSL